VFFLQSSYGKTLYGLSAKNLRMMAFQVRIKNGISNTISGQDKTRRWKRFLKFLNPTFSAKSAQATVDICCKNKNY
jgi:hypothetical protein